MEASHATDADGVGGGSDDLRREASANEPLPRVRALDKYARWILDSAILRFETVRDLARALEGTDVITYVQIAAVSTRTATTRLLDGQSRHEISARDAAPGSVSQHPDRAHGPRAAARNEIAQARSVRSDRDLDGLYRRIGTSILERDRFETRAAQDVERQVRREMATVSDKLFARRLD